MRKNLKLRTLLNSGSDSILKNRPSFKREKERELFYIAMLETTNSRRPYGHHLHEWAFLGEGGFFLRERYYRYDSTNRHKI